MSFDLSWPKIAALTAVQAASQTAIGDLVTDDSWLEIGKASGVSALLAFLGLVVAYKLPNGSAQVVSAAAPLNTPVVLASSTHFVADADEAKKPS